MTARETLGGGTSTGDTSHQNSSSSASSPSSSSSIFLLPSLPSAPNAHNAWSHAQRKVILERLQACSIDSGALALFMFKMGWLEKISYSWKSNPGVGGGFASSRENLKFKISWLLTAASSGHGVNHHWRARLDFQFDWERNEPRKESWQDRVLRLDCTLFTFLF